MVDAGGGSGLPEFGKLYISLHSQKEYGCIKYVFCLRKEKCVSNVFLFNQLYPFKFIYTMLYIDI